MDDQERIHGDEPYEPEQEREAAEEAAAIGGLGGAEEADESERALIEAGQGVSEGAELTDEQLVEEIEDPDLYPEDDEPI